MLNEIINIPERELTETEYREWIESCEAAIVASHDDVMDRHTCISNGFKIEEAMTPGIYTRELTVPAGQLVFTKVHLETHPFMVTKGKIAVYDGKTIQTIEAPYKGITPTGTKRVAYTLEETTWITFHPAPSDDLEEMDKNGVITCATFAEYDSIKKGESLCHL